jgi:hypothetical protein
VRKNLRYSAQPWTDPQRAARDGVAVIPTLTTPTGPAGSPPRTDIVYLDVWDREVGSAEDDNLINPAIGVETCTRLKREAAVRVAEGTSALPSPPPGHFFLPLSLLRRPVNEPQISRFEDIRPFFYSPQGTGVIGLFPAFLPLYTAPAITPSVRLPEWRTMFSPLAASGSVPKFRAVKDLNEAASGILPLTLPDRARLSWFSINGDISAPDGQLHWQILRISHQLSTALNANQLFDILAESTIRALSPGQSVGTTYGLATEDPKLVVDNGRYHYALLVRTFGTPAYVVTIHGMSIGYKYFGLAGEPEHEHD